MEKNNSSLFKNKRVLIRVDFNVPLDEKLNVADDSRIIAAIPTIRKVLNEEGRVIIISHLGRPTGIEKRYSLENILSRFSSLLGLRVAFYKECVGENAIKESQKLKNGEVLLLENLRFNPGEINGSDLFAQELSKIS